MGCNSGLRFWILIINAHIIHSLNVVFVVLQKLQGSVEFEVRVLKPAFSPVICHSNNRGLDLQKVGPFPIFHLRRTQGLVLDLTLCNLDKNLR